MKKFKNQILLSAGSMLLASVALTGCSTDDSFDASSTITNSDKTEIGFDAYIGNAATRAAINDKNSISLNSTGLGLFAMQTQGKQYDASVTDGTTETVFTPNFMNNDNLTFFNYGYDPNASYAWRYTPLRYWPQDENEYLTFTAYAPYKEGTQLYAKSDDKFTVGGEGASYYKHEVPADKSKQVDELYTDITKTSNMRYYQKDGEWVKSGGTFLDNYPDAGEHGFGGPKILMMMKHATSRIGIDMYCKELSSGISNGYKEQFKLNATDGKYEYTNTRIIVNKVMLLGDDKSAETDNPTGAFYGAGYLNLATATDKNPLWVPIESDPKVACTWDNTGSKLETVRGEGAFLGGHAKWIQGYDKDAPNIPGNEICGWRDQVEGNPYKYTSHGSGTEIGNDKDGYLFIIPQDFTTDDNKLYCYVDYTVRYADTGFEQHFKTYSQIKQKFEAGKAYRICIDFEISNPILFAVQFEDWPDSEADVETVN